MPLYEYRCKQCGHTFEKIQSFSAPDEKQCPRCAGEVERLLSAPAIQFKGSGFYLTDYGKAGGKAGGSGDAGKAGGEGAASTAAAPAGGSSGAAASGGAAGGGGAAADAGGSKPASAPPAASSGPGPAKS